MRENGRGGPDPGTVAAARDGDSAALDALVAQSLPLVYNIVGRALRGHSDVDDVVQETLLRVVRHLPGLREPGAYRSWLVAITVRRIRDHEQHRRAEATVGAGLDAAVELPDPGADFAAATILRLGLTDQRREVAEATRWLDPDDRPLLALWWLEATGALQRADLAAALDLSPAHAAVRVRRMKEQLQLARTVVRAVHARPGCPGLTDVAREWDGRPGPLWRKRLARHVRDCGVCAAYADDLVPVERLLVGLSLLPVPPHLAAQPVPPPAVPMPDGAPSTASRPVGSAGGGSDGAAGPRPGPEPTRRAGVPAGGRRLLAPVSAAVAVCLLAGVLAVAHLTDGGGASAPAPAERLTGGRFATPTAAVAPSGAVATPPSPSAPPRTPAAATPRTTATRATASPTAAPAAAPVVSSAGKGVGVWTFPGVDRALDGSGAGWYYTWNTSHQGVSTPSGTEFVPMIWGAKSVTPTGLAQARQAGRYLLGFNEPDMAGQSNMTPEQALDLWPQLAATGRQLGSPAVAFGGATPGGWLDRFMAGAKARSLRVDFIALHWYGGDFRTAEAVRQLRSYLQAVYDRYHLPIWLTEFALIRFSGGAVFPSQGEQAAFLTAATRMLAGLPWLRRYAWFGLPASDKDRSGLFRSGPAVTEVGRAFQAAR
ncbi:sigma-70 family RNA polymerase sigma factor [Micromonospora sp. CPCC 205711]|uniref:sigma-70 family RNA polymerase sigma factor n=1 Tax=Micromonospora sp. CPCC 205547 TaxID=3122400 RepID=UPI002FF233DB